MSITEGSKFFHVSLEFPLEKGIMHWHTQVAAEDDDGAVRQAVDALWSQMDYKGVKPKVKVNELYEIDGPAGHLADPMSHDFHEERE